MKILIRHIPEPTFELKTIEIDDEAIIDTWIIKRPTCSACWKPIDEEFDSSLSAVKYLDQVHYFHLTCYNEKVKS